MAKQMQQVLYRDKGPVKVEIQEQGGIKVKNLLQKPNPSKTLGCDNEDCLACKHGRGKGEECRRNNVGYVLFCDECGEDAVSYVGEKGQNEAVRISNCTAETKLNSKTEWHGPATVRSVAEGGGFG